MARYFHVTTPAGTTTTKVPEGWFPTIAGGMLALPDGTEIEASAISASRFESKRETPARDAKVKAEEAAAFRYSEAKEDFLRALGFGDEDIDQGKRDLEKNFPGLVASYTLWRTAVNDLSAHDLNVHRSREMAQKKKENPQEAKPPKAKATAKPKTPKK